MAFYMKAKNPVDVNNINYNTYMQNLSQGEWAVVAPLSLAGGGSIHLGTYKSKEGALERIKGYLDMLIKERTQLAANGAKLDIQATSRQDTSTL